jgi:hypothetical protein
MVCNPMGLLDDAIREHLELKRRRGADPGEVAREQRETLDDQLDPEAERIEDPSSLGSVSAPELATPPAASNVLEETAELDMRTVLDQRADSANVEEVSAGSTGAGLPVDRVPEAAAGEEPLEWEVPGEGMRDHPSEAAGPAAGPREAVTGQGVEHVHPPAEDLVAEMTDLPHDASEQDRLWLEPSAPRDADPDK